MPQISFWLAQNTLISSNMSSNLTGAHHHLALNPALVFQILLHTTLQGSHAQDTLSKLGSSWPYHCYSCLSGVCSMWKYLSQAVVPVELSDCDNMPLYKAWWRLSQCKILPSLAFWFSCHWEQLDILGNRIHRSSSPLQVLMQQAYVWLLNCILQAHLRNAVNKTL